MVVLLDVNFCFFVVQGAQYVCFNGPEKELPQGDTTYGTSLPLEKCMYDGNDILVGAGTWTRV
jgi:hypothetical protein